MLEEKEPKCPWGIPPRRESLPPAHPMNLREPVMGDLKNIGKTPAAAAALVRISKRSGLPTIQSWDVYIRDKNVVKSERCPA